MGYIRLDDRCRKSGMPEEETMRRARRDKRQGKAASTQAGEFVREEMDHIRAGEHGAASAKQAIAIGLSKARRAGVNLPPPKKGKATKRVREQAKRELKNAKQSPNKKPSRTRSRAAKKALQDEPQAAASHRALSRHAHAVARKKSAAARSQSAKQAARTRAKNS